MTITIGTRIPGMGMIMLVLQRMRRLTLYESRRDCRSPDIDGETETRSPEKDETESICERMLEHRLER
jgi:hypothetical protein